ncbi:MAG: hypothetical protein M0Q51_09010 [Bacteroidales bacterium]|nr:hypothetical protein [Bacteroidales bacterium]
MKSIMRSLLVIILFSFSVNLISQDAASDMDRVYGLDPLLHNGKKYAYFLPPGTGGNQFLLSPDYLIGDVTIKGEYFEGIALNYDIYNQQLLFQYINETGTFNIIEISKAWLESFRLGNLEFQNLSFKNNQRFYQILGDGPLFILYYWRKDLKLDATYGAKNFTFTLPLKSKYVLIGDQLHPFRNKRSLISLFDPGLVPEIKNYMHENNIRIKNASDKTMTELINYIGNL